MAVDTPEYNTELYEDKNIEKQHHLRSDIQIQFSNCLLVAPSTSKNLRMRYRDRTQPPINCTT